MRFRLLRTRNERGLALVSVLWGVSILALISSAMLSATRMGAHLEAGAWRTAQGDAIAEAAINRTILSLMDTRGGAPPLDGTVETVSFGNVAAHVAVQDEAGKIDLNFADRNTLKGLFASAGSSDDDAGTLADEIMARRAPPDPLHPPANPIVFRSVDEVLGLPHMTRALFMHVAPELTVYSKSASVDTNVASRDVLLVLPGMNAEKVDDVLKARAAQLPGNSAAAATGHAYMISVALTNASVRVTRRAVVQFTGDETKPYLFLAWD